MMDIDKVAIVVFFFQAEDGIRDIGVTGVQTCALPIFEVVLIAAATVGTGDPQLDTLVGNLLVVAAAWVLGDGARRRRERSEERRVGKECRSRWSPYH